MGKRVAGIVYVKVDGMQLEVKGSLEVPLMGIKRESVQSTQGVAGFKEEIIAPYVKCTAIVTADFPIAALAEAEDAVVTAELANGMVYTLSGAYLVGEPAIKADDGEIELEWNGEVGVYQ